MADFFDDLDPSSQGWLAAGPVRQIFNVIKVGGGEARVVGGAVRDTLLGRPIGEIDFAVNLAPDRIITILEEAGIKVVPTGFDHGTVTAVIDHVGYELTSLRLDTSTDGRRARVTFTDDWQKDAARRDFTFNALYADEGGKVYDFFAGRQDLKHGRVRFIGDASARIKEDVLRILRFFRFYAWFGKGVPDGEALAACHTLASLLPTLSAERVWREVLKLLAAPAPVAAWKLMKESGVLQQILHEAVNIARLEKLLETEAKYHTEPSAMMRLAALLPKGAHIAVTIAKDLKLSKREAEKLKTLTSLPDLLKGKLDPVPFRRALYHYGVEDARDGAVLLAADMPSVDLKSAFVTAGDWENPVFPLQGEDLLKMGMMAGPPMGELLRKLEEWWIEKDFRPTRMECLEGAKKSLLKSP